MARLARIVATTAGLAWLVADSAAANDVAFGGAGADLVPIAETRVQMVSEDIEIERKAPGGYRILGDGHWHIRASYRFRNVTEKPVRIQIGFPEPACPEQGDCSFGGFEAMSTSVRGQPTELTVGSVDSKHPWAQHIDKVHLFDVTFAPSEIVDIVHTYRHGLTEYVNGGEQLTYITRTGALWAANIETARFRIELPFRPWGVSLADWGRQLVRLTETPVDGRSQAVFAFEWQDWEPQSDLQFYFGPGAPTLESPALISGCPSPGEVFGHAVAAEAIDVSALERRTEALSREQLRRCRNALFAHHGKMFDDPDLNRFFYGEHGLQLMTTQDVLPGSNAVFAINPHYSPDLLSDAEWAYVKAIEMAEQAR